MARPEPYPRQIVEALVDLFRDRMADASYWHEPPLRVDRLKGPVDLKLVRPAILIKPGAVTPTPGTNLEWQDELAVELICLTADAPDPEPALEDLVADVRCILRAEFRGLDGLVDSGFVFENGYTWGVEQEEGKAGYGHATVKAAVQYLSTADTA